ncbi:zinc transporter ZIP1 [Bactrocera neohumeralis]|uniref:zinc transporter ZIP1 n=1 Tax=Bactrocera tryoni TaxID=59916 RepID=UPI001A95C3AA|nr:zinc transporter ZIP1 [Bactrocera tryoni]XP_050341387.1 zinc transporter ZIP1 [Bactrocera neohumeralis]
MLSSSNGSVDRGDGEKILAMCSLGLGSFLFGMLPAVISAQNRRRFPLTISLLLCFGAGILLATAIVHILPEVRKQMDSNFAEITICGGFFLIYFIDEFIHYFFGEAIQHTHSHATGSNIPNNHRNSNLDTDRTPLLNDRRDYYANQNGEGQQNSSDSNNESTHQHSYYNTSHCAEEAVIAESNARICHTSHEEPCVQSMTGTLGLFVALSLHSAIEGLAIGVQNSSRKVLFLLGAVACHKLVMGFCLGLEFRSNPQTTLRQHFLGIVVFALGAICGIGIGMIIADIPSGWSTAALPIVQALAGGTLFYVTVCEVIPREKSRWHQNAGRRIAGFGQFLAVISGFALMCCINYFLDDGDS